MDLNPKSEDALNLLLHRRSVLTRLMDAPGPSRTELKTILTAATRVPDHGKLAPWRFVVLEGDDQTKLGAVIRDALIAEGTADEKVAEKMQGYATQAPVLIVAISSPKDSRPIPVWEQELSTGAACMNILTAATAMGYGAQWLTGWASYSPGVAAGLGLADGERIAGLIFLGTATDTPSERPRPDLADHVTWGMPDAQACDTDANDTDA